HNTSLFFFSSRRRHTRSKRDWSSDVCSSDLPYSFYQDNELVGFDLELMYRFALWCNAELVIEVYDWYGIMPACTSGKVDYIMSNLFATEERREAMDFSDPYKTVRTVMVVASTEAQASEGFLDGVIDSFEK